MSYIFLYLLLPIIVLLIDTIASYKRLAKVTVVGIPPVREEADRVRDLRAMKGGVSAGVIGCDQFRIAIQNNESRPIARKGPKARLILTLRSKQCFALTTTQDQKDGAAEHCIARQANTGESAQCRDLIVHAGPDDSFKALVSVDRRRLVISLPYLRPLKTWTFYVSTMPGTAELAVELQLPKETSLRRGLQRLNEHTFRFRDFGYFSTSLVLRSAVGREETKRFWNGAFLNIFWPLFALSTLAYLFYLGRVVVPLRNSYELIKNGTSLPWFLRGNSLWADSMAFLIGLIGMYLLSRDKPAPVGDGYLFGKRVKTEVSGAMDDDEERIVMVREGEKSE